MPNFKQLAEDQKPADAERYILIKTIQEPTIGRQYTVIGQGIESNNQMKNNTTYATLEKARLWNGPRQ
jgi:hypothetical protein